MIKMDWLTYVIISSDDRRGRYSRRFTRTLPNFAHVALLTAGKLSVVVQNNVGNNVIHM